MKLIEVNFKKAAFGWPFYATWNLLADASKLKGSDARGRALLCAMPFLIATTGAWAMLWLSIVWMFLLLVWGR